MAWYLALWPETDPFLATEGHPLVPVYYGEQRGSFQISLWGVAEWESYLQTLDGQHELWRSLLIRWSLMQAVEHYMLGKEQAGTWLSLWLRLQHSQVRWHRGHAFFGEQKVSHPPSSEFSRQLRYARRFAYRHVCDIAKNHPESCQEPWLYFFLPSVWAGSWLSSSSLLRTYLVEMFLSQHDNFFDGHLWHALATRPPCEGVGPALEWDAHRNWLYRLGAVPLSSLPKCSDFFVTHPLLYLLRALMDGATSKVPEIPFNALSLHWIVLFHLLHLGNVLLYDSLDSEMVKHVQRWSYLTGFSTKVFARETLSLWFDATEDIVRLFTSRPLVPMPYAFEPNV